MAVPFWGGENHFVLTPHQNHCVVLTPPQGGSNLEHFSQRLHQRIHIGFGGAFGCGHQQQIG
jgi:hypothetical protein